MQHLNAQTLPESSAAACVNRFLSPSSALSLFFGPIRANDCFLFAPKFALERIRFHRATVSAAAHRRRSGTAGLSPCFPAAFPLIRCLSSASQRPCASDVVTPFLSGCAAPASFLSVLASNSKTPLHSSLISFERN